MERYSSSFQRIVLSGVTVSLKGKDIKKDIFCVSAIFAMFAVLVIRSFYGLDIGDESFCLAVTKRFADGSFPIVDDYTPAQLYGLITALLYKLYMWIVPDGTGIILAGRIFQAVLVFFGGLYLYRHMVKFSGCRRSIALLSALLFMFAKVSRIFGLGYYNLYIFFLVMGALMLSEGGRIKSIIAGLCFSCCLLCMPFVVLVVIGLGFYFKKIGRLRDYWFMFFTGVVCMGILAIYVLTHVSFSDIMSSVPYMLSHAKTRVNTYEISPSGILDFVIMMVSYLTAYLFFDILFIIGIGFFKLKHRTLLIVFFIEWFVATFASILFSMALLPDIAYLRLTVMGVFIVYIYPDMRKYKEALFYMVLGIAMSVAYSIGTAFMPATISGLSISSVGALMIFDKFADDDSEVRWLKANEAICFCITIILGFALRSYADEYFDKLTYKLDKGPGAGLYVSELSYKQTEGLFDLKDRIDELDPLHGDSDIAISKAYMYGYLIFGRKINACTTWNMPIDDKRNEFYYNGHKLPDILVLFDEDTGYKLRDADYEKMNADNIKKGWLYDKLQSEYDCYRSDKAYIYVRSGL